MTTRIETRLVAVEHPFTIQHRKCDGCGRESVAHASAGLVPDEVGRMYICHAANALAEEKLPAVASFEGWVAVLPFLAAGDPDVGSEPLADFCPDCAPRKKTLR